MKKLFVFIAAIVIIILVWIINNSRPLDESQFCTEKIVIVNNGHKYHYYVVHKAGCPEYKPFLKNRNNILDFKRHLYDTYCPFCFEPEDIKLFNSISKYNIQQFDNRASDIIDYEDMQLYRKHRNSLDDSSRGYGLYYVYDDEHGQFIEINTY